MDRRISNYAGDEPEAHYELLMHLVSQLLENGTHAARREWHVRRAEHPRPSIESHVRTAELKTIRSVASYSAPPNFH